MKALRRVLKVLGILVGLLVIAVAVLLIVVRHPMPEGGVSGPEADALAHEIEVSVNVDAWKRTGAVRFRFGNMQHLWDRTRNYARARWGKNEVFVNAGNQQGRAFVDGKEVSGAEKDKLVKKAYERFINDSFWFNPLHKLFDEGVTRYKVDFEGHPALLITYASGGVTPGDSYLWILDDNHRPRAWRMFVHVLPVGGVQASWEDWVPLSTGALVSTRHKLAFLPMSIGEPAGAATLAELEGGDPFAGKLP